MLIGALMHALVFGNVTALIRVSKAANFPAYTIDDSRLT